MSALVAGTYIILNALTLNYMNLRNAAPAPAAIVTSAGNHAANDYWNVVPLYSQTSNTTFLQSLATGDFVSVISDNVESATTVYTWNLIPTEKPYGYLIQDTESLMYLGILDDDDYNGAEVVLEDLNTTSTITDQVWFFVSTEAPESLDGVVSS